MLKIHINRRIIYLWEAPRTIFKLTFNEQPILGERYGFSGHTQLEELPHPTNSNLSVLCATQTILGDLFYTETKDDMHYFKLPGKHPGHIYFEGCSGAPIINERGQPVALVVGGDIEEDIIWGVPDDLESVHQQYAESQQLLFCK